MDLKRPLPGSTVALHRLIYDLGLQSVTALLKFILAIDGEGLKYNPVFSIIPARKATLGPVTL